MRPREGWESTWGLIQLGQADTEARFRFSDPTLVAELHSLAQESRVSKGQTAAEGIGGKWSVGEKESFLEGQEGS
jgi:hypothetical protein